jgi:ketosteroid isomerase-like protein
LEINQTAEGVDMTAARADAIRDYYRAYQDDDRTTVEKLLSADFVFTSPQDDHIDRATYFAKCWPGHEDLRAFRLLHVTFDGDDALVRYQATRNDGTGFQNVEHFEFRGTEVTRVDVYFGRPVAA